MTAGSGAPACPSGPRGWGTLFCIHHGALRAASLSPHQTTTTARGCHPSPAWLLLLVPLVLLAGCGRVAGLGEVIWAVNCGGGPHVDLNGVHYQKDMLTVGYASDHGKNIGIRRVPPQDQILYQTERYHTDSFTYSLPIRVDGEYILVLKFSEVWFNEPNQKVFNVQLNDRLLVVDNLDIFSVAGLGVAHDEIVPFSVHAGSLRVADQSTSFDGTLRIQFIKLNRDNPKINAIYVMRGSVDDVPLLPPLPRGMDRPAGSPLDQEDEEEDDGPEGGQKGSRAADKRRRAAAETKVTDPYAAEDPSSMLLPVFVAIGAFIPLVFCLCRL